MKKALYLAICFICTYSQSFSGAKDVTKKMNSILQCPQVMCELFGASLTDDGIIHATFQANDLRTAAFRSGNHPNVSLARARKEMTSFLLFSFAKNVFQSFPSANTYNVYVSTVNIRRDRYGNILSQSKEVIARLTMSRPTFNKINWDYLWSVYIQYFNFGVPEILQMIDYYYFDERYFE